MEFIRLFFMKFKGEIFPFFLNFLGFSFAFAAIGLSFLFVKSEMSYDDWIADASHAYRAHWILSPPGHMGIPIAAVSPRFADVLAGIPDITRVTRLSREQVTLLHDGNHYSESVQSADPNFLEAFGLSLQHGSRRDALNSPNAVVLTKQAADKYFPGKNPVGNVLELGDGTVLHVTGVLESIPKNTHLDLYMIISDIGSATELSKEINKNSYGDTISYTYFWINAQASPKMILDEINQRLLAAPLMLPEQAEMLKPVADIMPVRAIHLHNLPSGELKPGGSPVMVAAFLVIGVLLVLILCVNFSMLAVSRGQKHMCDYGVKRAFGASAHRLVAEEFYNNFLILAASTVLAVLLVYPLTRLVEAYTGIGLSAGILMTIMLMLPAPFIMALIATCAMFLPANAIFRKSIAALLSRKSGATNSLKNRIPVILQFGMAGFLVILTVIVTSQTNYALNTSLKSMAKPIYIVDIGGSQASPSQIQTAVERIETQKNVIAASESLIVPTNFTTAMIPLVNPASGNNTPTEYPLNVVDANFFQVYDLPAVAGRVFPKQSAGSSNQMVVSQSAARRLGFAQAEDAVGQRIAVLNGGPSADYQIIGVVADIILKSVSHPVEPLVYVNEGAGQVKRFLSIELAGFADAEELAALGKIWKSISGDSVFNGSYLQARLDALYRPLNQAGNLLRLLVLVALLTSALGIYAFSTLMSLRQRHETGIRRALGASRLQILVLMFGRFLTPVIIGLAVSVIPAYLAGIYWLSGYSYRINLGIMPLVISILVVSGVGALAVLSNAIRSTLIKPSEALRGS